ncbi:hypothetical protein BDQ12DRAFT_690625 [Crucibulum laeve]|uniref:Uncharacterized protein n=1 Tax=Crucibulum laeve TaxID=68775 RepID=A0A5C3LYG5_9AGAR|nr:hypothetical protein BDQ12DRAFT_690625 [Crucibulum laeve]
MSSFSYYRPCIYAHVTIVPMPLSMLLYSSCRPCRVYTIIHVLALVLSSTFSYSYCRPSHRDCAIIQVVVLVPLSSRCARAVVQVVIILPLSSLSRTRPVF